MGNIEKIGQRQTITKSIKSINQITLKLNPYLWLTKNISRGKKNCFPKVKLSTAISSLSAHVAKYI